MIKRDTLEDKFFKQPTEDVVKLLLFLIYLDLTKKLHYISILIYGIFFTIYLLVFQKIMT